MQRRSGLIAVTALCVFFLMLGGCPEKSASTGQPDGSAKQPGVADAVPISVSIVPNPMASPTKIDITITMSTTVIIDTPVLVFYDVRNPALADPDRHIDADMVLQLKPAVREVTCPAASSTYTFSVDLNETRAIATEVSVTAVTKSVKRGAVSSKTVPASGS